MNLTYLLNLLAEVRLRRKGDLAYRATYAAQRRLGVLRKKFPAVVPKDQDLLDALKPGVAADLQQFADYFDNRREPAFYFDPADRGPLPPHFRSADASQTALLKAADAILQRRCQALGSPEVHFPGEIDWSHSLDRDASWPRRHWTLIDFRDSQTCGDVKACWHWNRHYQFVTLGRAYRHTRDDRYVVEFVRLLDSWCAQNPPELGIHYASNLEIGLRCVSWLWAHHLMMPSPRYPVAARARLHLFIFYMARHLAANLNYTRWTGRNNHLVADASCLAVVALMYPELRMAGTWLDRSLDLLWRALDTQVLPGGMHFEMSPGYHQFVLECFFQVLLLMQRQGRPVPKQVLSRIDSMVDVVAALRQPDGALPNFNDCDEGTVWALQDTAFERTAALLAMRDAIGGRKSSGAGTKHSPRRACGHSLEHAGLYVMRSGEGHRAHFAMINNHPDPFPDSGHNHASLLQLLLWVDGTPVLIDGGTYRYNDAGPLRNALRGTWAHNAVVVDERDQAAPFRNFGWLARLRPGTNTFRESHDCVVFDGFHDCYQTLREPVRHRRTLVWLKDPCVWIVRDELSGRGSHRFRQMWHFPAARRLRAVGDGVFVSTRDGHAGVGIQLLANRGDQTEIVSGSRQHPWSWESPRYGELRPRTSLSLLWQATVPTTRVAAFFPTAVTTPPAAPLQQIGENHLRVWGDKVDLVFDSRGVLCTACSNAAVDRSAGPPGPTRAAIRESIPS